MNMLLKKKERYPAKADEDLSAALLEAAKDLPFHTEKGHTIATDDYYEGQGRLDGALPSWYNEEEKMEFLKKAKGMGVSNMEMEATVFLYFFQRLGLSAAIVCVALLDRLKGDQHAVTREEIHEWSLRPQLLAVNYLKQQGYIP